MKQLLLPIGTRTGAFLASADLNRKNWLIKGSVSRRLGNQSHDGRDGPKSPMPDAVTSPVTRTALL